MALLWVDGFDHYGDALTQMSLGGYSVVQGTGCSTASPRTGNYGFRIISANFSGFRRILDAPVSTCIVGIAQRLVTVPTVVTPAGIHFETGIGTSIIRVSPTSDLRIAVYNSRIGSTVLGQTEPNILTQNAYHYIEAKVIRDGVNGSVEVRVDNGDTATLIITGLNLGATNISSIDIGHNASNGTVATIDFDDFYICDDSTTINNDFLGDRRAFTSFVNADTVMQDWILSSGTEAFALLDNVPASDTNYVEATASGQICELDKSVIEIETNDIAGVVLVARALKTDAGVSSFRLGVHSGSTVLNSSEIFPTTVSNFWRATFERDPNGNIPWTRTNLDSAAIRLTREQ